MKKLISLLLVLAMALSLVACGAADAPAAEAPKADAPAAEAPAAPSADEGATYAHPLQDPRVRQALWYAIDIDAIVEGLWDNTVVAAKKSLVPEGTWQADGLTEYSYNPDLAKQLLAEAGWDGSYTIEAVYYTANLLDTITAIQAMWAEVGVKMEFQLLTDNLTALLWAPSADGVTSAVDWDIAFAGTNALTLGEFYNRHHSTAANNSTVKWNDELDALIETAKVAVTTEDQKAAYDAIQLYENADATVIPLFYIPSRVVTPTSWTPRAMPPATTSSSTRRTFWTGPSIALTTPCTPTPALSTSWSTPLPTLLCSGIRSWSSTAC